MDTLFTSRVTETVREQQQYVQQELELQRLALEVAEEVKKMLDEKFALDSPPQANSGSGANNK
jgi:hypothetical protein